MKTTALSVAPLLAFFPLVAGGGLTLDNMNQNMRYMEYVSCPFIDVESCLSCPPFFARRPLALSEGPFLNVGFFRPCAFKRRSNAVKVTLERVSSGAKGGEGPFVVR